MAQERENVVFFFTQKQWLISDPETRNCPSRRDNLYSITQLMSSCEPLNCPLLANRINFKTHFKHCSCRWLHRILSLVLIDHSKHHKVCPTDSHQVYGIVQARMENHDLKKDLGPLINRRQFIVLITRRQEG